MLGSFKLANQPMYYLYIDLIGPFSPSKHGNTYCLTACYVMTDYLFCISIPNKEEETLVQAYIWGIYSLFRGRKALISDNGTEFKNSFFAQVCKILNMTQHFLTLYLSSSNLVERYHSALKRCITKFCKKDASRWDKIVPYACLVQHLYQYTLEGEKAMFKMFR